MATAFTTALNSNHDRTSNTAAATNHSSWAPQVDHAEDSTPDGGSDIYDDLSAANGHAQSNGHAYIPPFPPRSSSLSHQFPPYAPPDPSRSPFALALYAILLSTIFTASILSLLYLNAYHPSTPLWRFPFFAYLLSQFHLLEYLITAYYNPSAATTSAFLLNNGHAYNIAHVCAFVECALHWHISSAQGHFSFTLPIAFSSPIYIATGSIFIFIGQILRTWAMAHAGANFTHLIADRKLPHHILVTSGPYRYLRHPAYMGFFWWGIGGQMVLGNSLCLIGFAAVLWRFFLLRVAREEGFLVGFFGQEYEMYRKKTWVGIPFVG